MDSGMLVYLVLIGIILCFGVFSNILVIVAVLWYRKLRTVTHVLICNLSVSDILLAVVFMPQKLHDISHPDHYHEGVASCKFIQGFPIFLITSSCFTLVFISFERRRAILESNKVQLTVTQTLKLLPVVWISSFIIAFPTMLEYTVVTIHSNNNTKAGVCSNLYGPRLLTIVNCLAVATLSFVIPLICMSYNYTKLIIFVNRKCKQVNNISDRTTIHSIGSSRAQTILPTSHLFRNRQKIIKMLSLMASGFAVCWMPFVVLFVYRKLSGQDASLYSSSDVTLVLNSMISLNTVYNVILYVIFNKMFRDRFKQMLRCFWKENTTIITVS